MDNKMTKEPIMIDDVDVAECEHIDFDCANCEIFANMCHENPNCYYKQLKRKEQECEELLKFNNSLVEEHKTIGNDLYKEIKDYRIKLKTKEEECEKKDKDIKFLLEKLDLANNRIQDCEIYWEKEKKNLKQQLDQLKAENIKFTLESRKLVAQYSSKIERLKQALQEIKEFVENEMKQDVNTRILLQKCEDVL